VSEPRIVYRSHPDATPEAELRALSDVYRFILGCAGKRDRPSTSGPNDAKKESKHVRAEIKSSP
jgi:hypothetical protein